MDTFVAYAPQLEDAILPQVADVVVRYQRASQLLIFLRGCWCSPPLGCAGRGGGLNGRNFFSGWDPGFGKVGPGGLERLKVGEGW